MKYMYHLKDIMTYAWKLRRYYINSGLGAEWTFAKCLKKSWEMAKDAMTHAIATQERYKEELTESEKNGEVTMHYSEYKRSYANCQTVPGSYNARHKTITVMTKVKKTSAGGLCPHCGTYCYGDCQSRRSLWG